MLAAVRLLLNLIAIILIIVGFVRVRDADDLDGLLVHYLKQELPALLLVLIGLLISKIVIVHEGTLEQQLRARHLWIDRRRCVRSLLNQNNRLALVDMLKRNLAKLSVATR